MDLSGEIEFVTEEVDLEYSCPLTLNPIESDLLLRKLLTKGD